MSSMMFYQDLVPLNDKAHADLRVSTISSYGFAARSNSVPVLAGEFAECAREFPIVFGGQPGSVVPAALLGLRDGENLFVDPQGNWLARYTPAFIRRYPFALGTGDTGQMLVCIDQTARCLTTTAGEALFVEGAPSAALQRTMAFLREFQTAAVATAGLTQRIEVLGLLREADSLAQLRDGSEFRLSGLRVIDESRLNALDDEAVLDLVKSGAMKLIYAHLISLGNLAPLMDRLSTRLSAQSVPVAKAPLKKRAAATT